MSKRGGSAMIAKRLRDALEASGVTKTELAAFCGVTLGAVSQWLDTGKISKENLAKAARKLNRSTDWFLGQRPHPNRGGANPLSGPGKYVQNETTGGPEIRAWVPLISWVMAGQFEQAVNNNNHAGDAEEWYPLPKKAGPRTYVLRVEGDSMTSAHGRSYPAGCKIFVDPEQRSPASGQRIIAKLKGSDEVTFKVFVREAGRMFLKPLNPQYPPIMDHFTVIGTVIGTWIDE